MMALDDWLQAYAFQPLVNAAYAHLGLSRKTLGIALFMISIFTDAYLSRLYSVCIEAIVIFGVVIPDTFGPLRYDNGLFNKCMRLFFVGTCLLIDSLSIAAAIKELGLISFVSALYVFTVPDPPRRKKKDWRSVLHKWAAQWTWIPVPAKT